MPGTKAVRTGAAAHAAACSPGSGDSEKTNIVTGSVGSACETSVEISLAAIDVVKRSGGVPPGTRARPRPRGARGRHLGRALARRDRRGEEERSRLAGDPGDRDDDPGENPADGRR